MNRWWLACCLLGWSVGFMHSAELKQDVGSRVLYVYGDVSEDGQVPSGEKEPFHQMRLSDTGPRGLSQFQAALEAVGFQVEEAYDAEVVLDANFLGRYGVVILGSNQRRFSKAEAEAVKEWVSAGGGLVVWSDSAFGGDHRKVGLDNTLGRDSDNDLVAQFGMFLLTDNGGGNYLVNQFVEPHYLNRLQVQDGLAFRGEGVSPIRVSPPARMLAALQEGGLGGKIRLNRRDEPLNLKTDAALAVAEVGRGRVVATFDRNTFWNAGEGTRLSHVNNREYAQRLLLWAAGREDVPLK
ncbi:MAG: ThuA domain-containing protein [Blastochloris sp.]|nr:ThuA domain-containing protein [Blastochloris sp.]